MPRAGSESSNIDKRVEVSKRKHASSEILGKPFVRVRGCFLGVITRWVDKSERQHVRFIHCCAVSQRNFPRWKDSLARLYDLDQNSKLEPPE